MTVDDIINYGDSMLAIGKTRGLPMRARIVGSEPNALAPGRTIKLGWAADGCACPGSALECPEHDSGAPY